MRIYLLCRSKNRQTFLLPGLILFLLFSVTTPVISATLIRPLLRSQPFVTSSTLSNFQLTDKKVDFELLELQFEYNLWKQQNSSQQFSPLNTSLPLRSNNNDFIVVDAVAQRDADSLIDDLNTVGCKSIKSYQKVVSATCPINAIDNMSGFDSLNTVRPALSVQNAGSTTSQGDVAMRSDIARSTFNVNGNGITIGTLSDSYDCLGNAAANVISGDLPSGVNVLDDSVCPNGTDEGRAMMQIITDIAPGASQSFHTASNGIADFANGIQELQQSGADVINDDVLFLAEPFFQDGVIAQAVDTVKAAGAAYFSSAGNSGRNSYESAFRPSGVQVPGIGDDLHDFDSGAGVDIYQQITLPIGVTPIVLQWAEPYFSVSGVPGSGSNYNIFVCLDNTMAVTPTNCPVFSLFDNFGNDPIEILGPNVTGGPLTAFIAISRNSGASNNFLKYLMLGGSINEYATNSSTSVGHANASGAEAVGAAVFALTPEFPFATTPILNNFSSAGGTPILFDINGNAISELRQKPEIVAPDGVNTTFFGNDVAFDADAFPNFFGTSAAAPHAAAAAALMLEAAGGTGSLTPDQVYAFMETTAIDIVRRGPPGPLADPGVDNLPVGFDFDSGFGLIQTDAAILSAIGTPCNGDFDNDNDVDNSDAFVFAQAFGSTRADTNYNPDADFDNDGDIDNSDAFLFAQDFGRLDCLESIVIDE